jgi:hypothetical protein
MKETCAYTSDIGSSFPDEMAQFPNAITEQHLEHKSVGK